jgi:hypothetical protein
MGGIHKNCSYNYFYITAVLRVSMDVLGISLSARKNLPICRETIETDESWHNGDYWFNTVFDPDIDIVLSYEAAWVL